MREIFALLRVAFLCRARQLVFVMIWALWVWTQFKRLTSRQRWERIGWACAHRGVRQQANETFDFPHFQTTSLALLTTVLLWPSLIFPLGTHSQMALIDPFYLCWQQDSGHSSISGLLKITSLYRRQQCNRNLSRLTPQINFLSNCNHWIQTLRHTFNFSSRQNAEQNNLVYLLSWFFLSSVTPWWW